MGNKKFSSFFNFKKIDGHLFIAFFGLRFRIKCKTFYKIPTVKEYGLTLEKRTTPLVASLTSFPQRINTLHIVIKSLLTQDLKPDYLVLYLAQNQFPNKENDLPQSLLELKSFGLEIKWCEDDIRSYKKLIPALKDFSDAIIITFDDDIVYKKDTIKTLYQAYQKNPNNIYAQRSARLYLDGDEIKNVKMNNLILRDYSKPDFKNRLTGCAGVLYPPKSLFKDVLDKNIFYNLIPTHDDVWFWAMAVLNNKKVGVVKGFSESLVTIENSQNSGLCKENNSAKGINTTAAYKKIVQKYPEIFEKLKEENE